MFNNNGYSLSDIAAATGSNGNDGEQIIYITNKIFTKIGTR